MVRGTGKFKQKRGGGRSFSKFMTLDENGTAVPSDRRWRNNGVDTDDDDDEDEEEEEEDEEDESEEEDNTGTGSSNHVAQPELTRAERRTLKKKQGAKKEQQQEQDEEEKEEDSDLINPNHVQKKLNISDLSAPRELSRREREQKEKQEAKDRYWQLHSQGKTDQAKADLARLAKIRAEREAAQAKRKAEAEAKAAEVEAKKKAAAQGRRI